MRLVVGNSYSQLVGMDAVHYSRLRKILSYVTDHYQGRYNHRYLIDVKGQFPTGLLYLVASYLFEYAPDTIQNDTRTYPKDKVGFTLKLPFQPYPEQLEAAAVASTHGRGIICAPTGVGKSAIVALLINEVQVPTLVVVPSLELKRQLSESLREAFGSLAHIRVDNIDALDPKKPPKGVGCLIIDEFHHSAAKTYRDLNKKAWTDIYYRFGLTATPFRNQDSERLLLESILSDVVYQIQYKTAVEKGYIVPVEPYYIELPKRDVKGFTWAEVYKEIVVENEPRNAQIRDMLLHLDENNISALCLVKEIAHGENVCAGTGIPFANGLNEETKRLISDFNSRKINVLVGTTGILGEGIDTRPAEYVVIAGLGKARGQFMQQVGRAVRRYPGKETAKVIIFKDESHKWSLAHFRAQVKVLKDEYGVKPVVL